MSKSRYFARLGKRPLAENIVEVVTGIERRFVQHFPFVINKYESIWSNSLKKYLITSNLIEGQSNYEYVDCFTGLQKQTYFGDRRSFKVIDVKVDLYYGNIFSSENILLAESTIWSEFFLNAHFVPSVYGAKKLKIEAETLILPGNSFYHFLLEDLPDFLRLYSLSPKSDVIVWEHAPKYIAQALSFLEIEFTQTQRFIKLDRLEFVEKSKVIAPTASAVDLLRKYFKNAPSCNSDKNKVYISRLGDSRSPDYESELIRLLEKSGEWKILNLAKLNFREQISYAKSASVWAGVHGAGLSWIPFLNPTSIVIEIGPAKMDCFQQLAFLSDRSFHRIESENDTIHSAQQIFNEITAITRESV